MCDCPDAVKDRRVMATTVAGATKVAITICNCDRRRCQVCGAYGWLLNAAKCQTGHPLR